MRVNFISGKLISLFFSKFEWINSLMSYYYFDTLIY